MGKFTNKHYLKCIVKSTPHNKKIMSKSVYMDPYKVAITSLFSSVTSTNCMTNGNPIPTINGICGVIYTMA